MTNNYFYIKSPYFSAGLKYSWGKTREEQKDEWGIGLEKGRIDELANYNKVAIVRYYKSKTEYTISAKKVQSFPLERVKNYNTFVYIVPKSALNYRKEVKSINDMSEEEIMKIATS